MPNINNPIIRIVPAAADRQARPNGGGGGPTEVVPVTAELRQRLSGMIANTAAQLAPTFHEWADVPAVVTLKLRPRALAKSHRPTALLQRAGMLPVGARQLGELLLPAKQANIQILERVIQESTAKLIKANISTIEGFSAYTRDDVLGFSADNPQLREDLAAWVNAGKPVFLEAFNFDDQQITQVVQRRLDQLIAERNGVRLYPGLEGNQRGATFLRLHGIEDVLALASFPGIRALTKSAEFGAIDIVPQGMTDLGPATAAHLPPRPPNTDIPTVGVIDSGVAPNEPFLVSWLDGVNTYVLPPETDYVHGTFVGGMIAGDLLPENSPELN